MTTDALKSAGLSVHLVMSPMRLTEPRRQYFFDFRYGEGQGTAFYLNPGSGFTFAVFDRNGGAHSIDVPADETGFPLDEWSWFGLEAGSSGFGTVIRVSRNGEIISSRQLPFEIDFGVVKAEGGSIGADRRGQNGASFKLSEKIIYNILLSPADIEQMKRWMKQNYGLPVRLG